MRGDARRRHFAGRFPLIPQLSPLLGGGNFVVGAGPREAQTLQAMAVALPGVVEELLSEMAAAVRESARIPDEHLLSLKFIFGASAVQALDLVDRHSVTLISSPSGRRAYQVLGSSGKTYTCLASCHYCSCPAFAFSVLRKSDSLLVSHVGAGARGLGPSSAAFPDTLAGSWIGSGAAPNSQLAVQASLGNLS
ncbi:zinc finger SWIM domain-containing protein 7 isoform X2 [Oryctolagus cuniculus]|uniref:zinc finger SWIM domain-containing protein 7 isoform X2 n=1 Tax=Oryctolagus cuniculus TaxID=9986 RepID=UPI00222F8631|nr:zinc finger SWIM domain-containing protein 7 isoform X2 [Oryctolagus cuniculus]